MKQKSKITLGLLAATTCFASIAPTTHADPPANSGWDKTPDVVVGGGSDTTYLVSQRLEGLYNGAPGCAIVTSGTSALKGKCSDTTATPTGPVNGNYDHDVMVSAAAAGSGAGINALLSTGTTYNPSIDYARSSRAPSGAAETNDTTFWGYARDGIAVITFGGRSSVSLTQQNLKDIYQCKPGATDWSDFGGAPGKIIPWDMQSSSGTYKTFTDYLGTTAFGTCVQKLTTGFATPTAPFENDVKPILADKGPDGNYGTADDTESNYIWWMSYGNWLKYPFTKNGKIDGTGAAINSQLVTVDGTDATQGSIFDSSYAIMRTLYQVTRDSDADCRQTPNTAGPCDNAANTVYGTTLGKGGAVRQFTQWLCQTSAATHAINTVTGKNYRTEIVNAINAEGFQQLSDDIPGLRTAGYSCSVATE